MERIGLLLIDIPQGFSSTCGIANKGLSGMQSVVTRLKVRCNLIGGLPAIPYWPYRHRCGAF